jgi:hypothetical protein
VIGFLERLVAANLGTIEDQVRPRLHSRFESPPQSAQLAVDGDAPHQVNLPTPATQAQRPRDLRPVVDERRLDDRIRAIAARQLSRPQRESTHSRDDEDAAVVRSRGSDGPAGQTPAQTHGVPPRREVAPQTPSPARASQPARRPSPAEEAAVVVPATAVPARAASSVEPAHSKPQGERSGREGARRDRHSGRTGERERESSAAREARGGAARQARDDVAGGEPTPVTITIGRIEVRVVPPQPAENPVRGPRQPSQSLDEYLTRRRDAGR